MHPALVIVKMTDWMLALSINRELVPCAWWCLTIPRPFIANISPDPSSFCAIVAGCQHLYRRIISKQCLTLPDMFTNRISQRFQQGRGFTHPVSHGRAIQINAFALVNLGLAIKRQMISILRDQHMGQETRTGTAPLNRS